MESSISNSSEQELSLLILYATETGTAHDFGEQIWRSARRRCINHIRLVSIEDYHIEALPTEHLVLFIIATSGQGECPQTMRSNWRRLLVRVLPKDWLVNLNISVLGLGDSSYTRYNFAGKKLFRRMIQLGAQPITPLVLADDQHPFGADAGFSEWCDALWPAIFELSIFPEMTPDETKSCPLKYKLEFLSSFSSHPALASTNFLSHQTQHHSLSTLSVPKIPIFLKVMVLENKRITAPDHFQDTRLISLDMSECRQQLVENSNHNRGDNGDSTMNSLEIYRPGDVLMVHPENLPDSIAIALGVLNYPTELLNKPLRLVPNDPSIAPPPCWLLNEWTTIKECLSRYFDLQAVPKRSLLMRLSYYSPDQVERDRLMELSSKESLDDYLDYCFRPKRTISELLRDFPLTATNLTAEQLFDILPTIRPRSFSIASSPSAHPDKLQILVARVQFQVPSLRSISLRQGLCSNFLCSLKAGDYVFVRIRPGTFRLGSPAEPYVFIAAGTGIAPIRSILSEFASHSDSRLKHSLLIFGCRNKLADFYFNNEWNELSGLRLFTAFSRDQTKKIYVQHRIVENASLVWQFLRKPNSRILIAGSSGEMPKAVVEALKQVIATQFNNSACNDTRNMENLALQPKFPIDSDKFLADMERSLRLQFETWS